MSTDKAKDVPFDDDVRTESLGLSSLLTVIDKPTQPRTLPDHSVASSSTAGHDDTSVAISKLKMDLRAAQFRLMQAESERDNLKVRLGTTEAELMDLYSNLSHVTSPASTTNVDLSPGSRNADLKKLEKENEALKRQISALKKSNTTLKLENEKLREEGRANTQKLEVGLTDTISFDEITGLVETFNSEVVMLAHVLAHDIYRYDRSRGDREGNNEKARERTSRILGDPLTEVLVKQANETSILRVVFVEIVLRAFMVEMFSPEIGSWPGANAKVADAMTKVCNRMRKSESALVSQRWRALTAQYLREPTYPSNKEFLDRFSSLFMCAGWSLPGGRINDTLVPFLKKIEPIVVALNVAFFQKMQTYDIYLTLASFNGAYNSEWAKDIYREQDLNSDVSNKGHRVAATVSLGYRKQGPLVPHSPDAEQPTLPKQCVVTTEVVLTSTMESITGITFPNTARHVNRIQLLSMGDGRE